MGYSYSQYSRPRVSYGAIEGYTKEAKKRKPAIALCPECGAIEKKRRWLNDSETPESLKVEYEEILCPGCNAVKKELIEGEVVLKNKITFLVPSQIEEMIKNIEEEHRHSDLKNRIVKIRKFKNMWKVFTASTFLARQIGEALEKHYRSKTHCKFSKGEKFVTVIWE